MLTVLVPTRNDEDALARMLPALVTHAVSGNIVDVIVIDAASQDGTRRVAEIAGCTIIDADGADVPALVELARGPWLLILEPGARPIGDWIGAVETHVNSAAGKGAARFSIARDPDAPWWRRMFAPGRATGAFHRGLLISRSQAAALARPGMALADLPRGLAVRTLRAAVRPPSA